MVDANIISALSSQLSALSSTKNGTGKRDRSCRPPEMDQTRNCDEWHFGMKMHIRVDDALGLVSQKYDILDDSVGDVLLALNGWKSVK